jgi:hypothetical protein
VPVLLYILCRYVCLPFSESQLENNKLHKQYWLTKCEGDVRDLLKDTMVRGLPRILNFQVKELTRRSYHTPTHTIQTQSEWIIVTHGSNFKDLFKCPAVNHEHSRTSFIYDVLKMLGIQASKRWLEETLEELVRSCESRVDNHHIKLISGVQTRAGILIAMTRNGMVVSSHSTPCRLLFENALENIKKSGTFAARDDLKGVPEAIFMGNLAPVGTGFTCVEPFKQRTSDSTIHIRSIGFRSILDDEINQKASDDSAINNKEDKEKQVEPLKYGMREVPCVARSFYFFQQFVPLRRDGSLAKKNTNPLSLVTAQQQQKATHLTHPTQPMLPVLPARAIATIAVQDHIKVEAFKFMITKTNPQWRPAPPLQTLQNPHSIQVCRFQRLANNHISIYI